MKQQLKTDYLKARKEHDAVTTQMLGVLIGEIELSESRTGKELSNSEIMKIIKKSHKNAVECKKYGSSTANLDIMILENYIPNAIEYEEVKCIIITSEYYQQIIDSDKPMQLMGSIKGMFEDVAAEGKDIAKAIKEIKAEQNT